MRSLEKKVGFIEPGESGAAIIKLNEVGIKFSRRGFTFQSRKENLITFSDIERILWGNVHPEITPIYKFAEVRNQHGLLVLQKPQKKCTPLPPLVFITGQATSEWIKFIKSFSQEIEFEQIIHSYKYASHGMSYDLTHETKTPHLTWKIAETGTLFVTAKSLTFCKWPAYANCVSLQWEDVESVVVPGVTLKMLDEVFFDFLDERTGKLVGFLVKQGIRTVPYYDWVDNGFKILKGVIGLEKFFFKSGSFFVQARKGKQPNLMVFWVDHFQNCLSIIHGLLQGQKLPKE